MSNNKLSDSKDSKNDRKNKKESLIEPKYYPIVVDLTSKVSNIFNEDPTIKFSSKIDYPNCSLGYNRLIHYTKNKTEILNQFEGKKQVHLVMNTFERYVDNYDKDIKNESKTYFGIGDNKNNVPDILSRGFYKLWEIFFMFDLIDLKQINFVSAHLAEGPGSFIQATMFFRDLFCKKGLSKNDKYYAVTLHPEDEGGHVPELEKKFVKFYEKEKPQRFILHKTYTKKQSGGNFDKDNGDLTDPKTINLFGGQMDQKAHIVTADGGFDWLNENTQEQEAFRLILAQIIAAIKIQKIGGHFVCKFFETYTTTSVKMIAMLSQLYKHVYFVKPLTSRPSNSEKYVVCMNFKYEDKDKEFKNILKKLDQLLQTSHDNKTKKIVDIFPSYKIPTSLITFMIQLNTAIGNKQIKSINEIITFVKAQNYYGDQYQVNREKQIEGSIYWIQMFFPESNRLKDSIDKINDIKLYSIEMNKIQEDELFNRLFP